MKNLNPQSNDDVRIELVPLIDVIFCILIFFILAVLQLARQQAIQINLPQATTASIQTRQTLIVSVDSIGQVYVDQTPVSMDQLFIYLQGYQKSNPQGLMLLYADQSSIYSDVVRVLDLMRSVGGDRVALATQPQEGRLPGAPQPGTLFNNPTTNPANPLTNPGTTPGLPPLPNGLGLPNSGGLTPLPGGLPSDGLPSNPLPGNAPADNAAPGNAPPVNPAPDGAIDPPAAQPDVAPAPSP
jgi:biopolymer transport protein ExbD